MKNLGIENIKKTIDFALKTFYKIQSLSGGWLKIVFSLALFVIKNWKTAMFLFRNYDLIYAEYKDIDEKERLSLILYFSVNFRVENKKIELIIEKAFKILVSINEILNLFRKWQN